MANEDDAYRRKEEEIWRAQTDRALVNLTTAQTVTHDRLDQMDEVLDALDRAIRGSYQHEQGGIMERLEELEKTVRRLHDVVLFDSTGKKGLATTVENIVSGKLDNLDRRKQLVSVIIAIISSIALVLTNLDRIGEFWVKLFGKPKKDPLEQMIYHAKHPHVKHIVPHEVVEPDDNE